MDADAMLTSLGIPHVFTGSFALAWYGTPRGTKDLDVVVHSPPRRLAMLLDLAERRGIRVDRARFFRDLERKGYAGLPFPVRTGGYLVVEFILSDGKLAQQMLRRSVDLRDAHRRRSFRFVTVEDWIVRKLTFGRGKDFEDVETVLRSRTPVSGGVVLSRLRSIFASARPDIMTDLDAWFRASWARNRGVRR